MNKNVHIFASMMTGALLSISMCGCREDSLRYETSSAITFNVSMAKDSWGLTRGDAGRELSQPVVRIENATTGDSLFLHPSVSDYPASTRGTMVTSQDEMYDRFYVSAYHYEDTWDDSHLKEAPNYFQTQVAGKSGDVYTISPARYWPAGGKMRFLAHSPVEDAAFTFYPQDDAGRGARVHIKIADDINNQNDLLVSYSEEIATGGARTSAPLNFKHALTGIRFVADKKMNNGIITNITIKGVRYEGDFFYNMQSSSQSSSSDLAIDANFNCWELYDRIFSLDMNYPLVGEDEAKLNDGENTFVMLPQTLPEGAVMEITLQHTDADGNALQEFDVLSGSLAGREWPAGKIVTYKLSTSSQVLEVEEPAIFNYLGSVYNATDDSWLAYNPVKVASSAGSKNMRWKVEYQDEGASTWSNASSWLSVDPTWTWQDAAEQDVRFVAKSSFNAIDIDKSLQSNSQKGSSASPYNLSNSSGASAVQNTANCYMVDAPGYYMLPLVYGNAIKDSKTNEGAYVYSSGSGTYILSRFVNHLGAGITAPYIADNSGCVPDHASIIWQDAKNLVQNVEYVPSAFGGKGGVRFYVSPSDIAQGNAVVAINDKNSVMWSWHIWVTDFSGFDNLIDVANQDNRIFSLMPVNLGWCSNGASVRYYPKRKCKVRFIPIEGDRTLSQEITFVQESHTSIPFGNNPYYQWGRKDPFVGTNIAWGNKERWDGTGKYYGTASDYNPPRLFSDLVEDPEGERLTTIKCLDLLIKNPDKWHNPPAKLGGSSYVSANETYTNLWGDNALGDTKTVYDPSPAGYQVNYFYTYTGFLASGYDWSGDKGIEFVAQTASDWDATNQAEFYTDSSKLHSITFPVAGYRDWNDKAEVVDYEVRGFIWMRGCSDNVQGYMFRYAPHISGQANVAPVTMFFGTDGLPVRPALSK